MSIKIDVNITKTEVLTQKEKELRREASRLVSLANKRLKRIEQQDLIESPAYKKYVEDGKQKFGIRGKSMEEVKQEIARINDFINKKTSTVTGTKQYLDNVAKSVGITKFENYKQLQNQLNTFFRGVDKVKEYLQNSKEVSVAIGYSKIFEVVSNYVEEVGSELDSIEDLVVEMAEKVVEGAGYGKADEMLDDFMNKFLDNF